MSRPNQVLNTAYDENFTTKLVHTGRAFIETLIIYNGDAAGASFFVYDGTDATGQKIAKFGIAATGSTGASQVFELNHPCETGIFVTCSSGAATRGFSMTYKPLRATE